MTAAKVFVVAWELQESENGEVCGVVGVYATESSARLAAFEVAEDWMKATFWDSPVICIDGNVRYPEGQRGEKFPSWDVWITVEEMEVHP